MLQKLYHGPQFPSQFKEWQFTKIPIVYEAG